MNSFDPGKHPRGNPNNGGQFAAKQHDDCQTELPAGTPIVLTKVDDRETFFAAEIDQDNDGPINCVDVNLVEHEDGTGGKLDLSIEPIANLNITGLQPAGMTDAQWIQKLDDHYPAVISFLSQRYDAGIDLFDGTDQSMWADIQAHFYLQIPNRPITQEEAFDIAWNQTKAVQLYNESDHGTYGTENLGRLLNEAMDASVVLPGNRYDIVREAEGIGLRDIDSEVRARSGEREIRDVTAVAIAQQLSQQRSGWFFPQKLTELSRLGRHGWVNRQALHGELRVAWDSTYNQQERLRIDMMFTWLEHGGDNG